MDEILRYFNQEKRESLLFILLGLSSIIVSAWFTIKIERFFYNGVAYSLVSFAIIQLVVGIFVYIRSPKDIIRVSKMLEKENELIKNEEIPRMKRVVKKFSFFIFLELAALIAGISLFLLLSKPFWKGVGTGLIVQSTIMLVSGIFNVRRGRIYLKFLRLIV